MLKHLPPAAMLLALLMISLSPVAWSAEPADLMPRADRSLLLDAAKAGERWVLVGERGHILVQDGAVWRQVASPSRAMLTSVYFVDAVTGFAAGHDATILRSRDGGESWQLVYEDIADDRPILDLWFADENHGIAVGAYGLLLETRDGGESWEPGLVSEDEDFHLNAIAADAQGRLFIAAEAGAAYRSDDGGQSWQRLDAGYEGSFYGLLPLAGDSLLMIGLRGHVYRSDDGGDSWSEQSTGISQTLNDGLRLDDGRLLLAGLGGALLVSRDGRSWEDRSRPDRLGISRIIPADNGGFLLVGENGIRRVDGDEVQP